MPTVAQYISRIEAKASDPDDWGCIRWLGAKKPNQGHGRISYRGKWSVVHRVVYELLVGAIPAGLVIDHICGHRDCINPSHLRAVTHQQNAEHRVQLPGHNTSGYPGVSWNKEKQRWKAYGASKGTRVHLGYHASARAAYEAWRDWARVHQPFMDDRLLSL